MGARKYDWGEVQRYHDEGHGFRECRARFGMAHATWKRAISEGLLVPRKRCAPGASGDARRVYDWSEVQAYYDRGFSMRQTQEHFGFSNAAWHKAKLRGEVVPRAGKMPIEELLARGRSRYNVKLRLLKVGLLKDACAVCELTHWRGRKLSLHIDHINGERNDHRLENLRMLCPNCHSQTDTYGGLNVKRKRRLQDPPPTV